MASPMVAADANQPNPEKIITTLNAHQETAALQAAIDLDVFTAIGKGEQSVAVLAKRCAADERGIRILCDALTVMGFVTKREGRYALTVESALFLDRSSPACIAAAADFYSRTAAAFKDLASAVRKGGVIEGKGTVEDHNPIWVAFARSLAPMVTPQAEMLAEILNASPPAPKKVLDVSASHGMYGISLARRNPVVEIYALDWPSVLEVAVENARAMGLAQRYHTIAGSAFDQPLGSGYDLILLPNFLHHFDKPTNEAFLRKVHAALARDGRAVTVEFVPDEDRISPPAAAMFSLMMLATTPSGDAYTFSELHQMFEAAGFASSEHKRFPAGPESIVISKK